MNSGTSPSPRPVRPGPSGCLIALLVVGVLLGLVCVAGGAGLVAVLQSEPGQKVLRSMQKARAVTEKASKAPGIKEVKAAGCQQANIFEVGEVLEMIGEFVDAGPGQGSDERMVQCQTGLFGTPPTCDDVALAYARAVTPERTFVVIVSRPGNDVSCQRRYLADGTFLQDLIAPRSRRGPRRTAGPEPELETEPEIEPEKDLETEPESASP